ncbi:MAG: DUF1385 domain-containing protein [Firmicutes bacterium]|nr:DUF1385 domain-containing protein [Bacillota bacterium]
MSRQLGGQAVIEGVMMRGESWVATAVRREDGDIVTDVRRVWTPPPHLGFLRWPVVRGATSLIYSLILGIQALSFSASQFGGEEEKLTTKELVFTMLTALLFGVGLFILLPTVLMRWLGKTNNAFVLSLGEGFLRLGIFLVYIVSITFIKDVRRIFEYHGAEHKVVHAYEAKGLPLTAADAAPFSTLHPRCGTSFLLYVMVVSILLFAFLGWPTLYLRVLSRLLMMPLVAGLSYEWLRLAGRSNSSLVKLLSGPGLWLQKLTTREPDQAQIEVALVALREVAQREPEVIL